MKILDKKFDDTIYVSVDEDMEWICLFYNARNDCSRINLSLAEAEELIRLMAQKIIVLKQRVTEE